MNEAGISNKGVDTHERLSFDIVPFFELVDIPTTAFIDEAEICILYGINELKNEKRNQP